MQKKATGSSVSANPDQGFASCFPCRKVGEPPWHHFFGYYNKSPWDSSGRHLLANRVKFMDAQLRPNVAAEVGAHDLQNNAFEIFGQTTTWNWQMGCQLQWIDWPRCHRVIYNTRTQERNTPFPEFCSVIYDLNSKQSATMPLPIYCVSPDGEYALSVNYSRLQQTHPTIGYLCKDGSPSGSLPSEGEDGIFKMDLATGDYNLILAIDELKNFHPVESMIGAVHWISHVEICPNSMRFLFLHRWSRKVEDELWWLHRLFTADTGGGDIHLLESSDQCWKPPNSGSGYGADRGIYDHEKAEDQISHPVWRDDKHILVWSPHGGSINYHLYRDMTTEVQVIGRDVLTENGHMSFSPDKRWILTDTYPDRPSNRRKLLLFDTLADTCHVVGEFYATPDLSKVNRCDLHPRWSPDGSKICIDSVHENERQMYVIDVTRLAMG